MEKLKYPKVVVEEKLKVPAYRKKQDSWYAAFLNEDGTTEESNLTGHHTEDSCWRVCLAYNNRIGYKEDEVKKIIKETGYGKKSKKAKDKKSKDKKGKKDKKSKKSKKNKS